MTYKVGWAIRDDCSNNIRFQVFRKLRLLNCKYHTSSTGYTEVLQKILYWLYTINIQLDIRLVKIMHISHQRE